MTDYIFFLFFLMAGILNNIHCKENYKKKTFATNMFYLIALIFEIRINLILRLLLLVFIINLMINNHLNGLEKHKLFQKKYDHII